MVAWSQSCLLAIGAVFLAVVFISSPEVAVFVVICISSVTIDLVGFIWLLNPPYDNDPAVTHDYSVDINAVSVVNLITAIGLSVEFCVHLSTCFVSRTGVCRLIFL